MTIKIIAGKRYNTETATRVAEDWNGLPRNDFNYVQETLYRTPRGTWFLCGSGGALSKYSRSLPGGGSSGQSDVITPISPDEARRWLEINDEIEAIEQYFGDDVEDA